MRARRIAIVLSICGVLVCAAWREWFHRGVLAARVGATFHVFNPRQHPAVRVRTRFGMMRQPVSAVAVMIWNRDEHEAPSRSATIVLEPRSRIVAVRMIAAPKSGTVTIDSRRAASGELRVTWSKLAPDEGFALHIAKEGWGWGMQVKGVPSHVYWLAYGKQINGSMFVLAGFAIFTGGLAAFGKKKYEGCADVVALSVLCVFACASLLVLGWFLIGYLPRPPQELRAAIAARYPQWTIFGDKAP